MPLRDVAGDWPQQYLRTKLPSGTTHLLRSKRTKNGPSPPRHKHYSRDSTEGSPEGANCLGDCGPTFVIDYSAMLDRGRGHAKAGTTRAGVNGLFDMGANVWEWVENGDERQKGTRGGSWWYGATQMQADYDATKPRDMAVVYIGFRCVKDIK